MRTSSPSFTINYFVDYFVENVDTPNSKFERVVFHLGNIMFVQYYTNDSSILNWFYKNTK